ncbi:unnamed protein product [Pseudo-nitzschia multistriata]|uniref:Splicing factor Cactin n=1 Tax=Pseudo-nitzschia multistriata TaxID=183589 RepID=A0A448ZLS4_9STRA|nr:unnamed protein product [Pseudo-nitzschia multistriata]
MEEENPSRTSPPSKTSAKEESQLDKSSQRKSRKRRKEEGRHRRRDRRSSRERRSRKSSRKESRRKRKKRRRRYSSSSENSDSSSSNSSSSDDSDDSSIDEKKRRTSTKSNVVLNKKLLAKLDARGETLEERKERRAQKRAAKIQARFGYTAEDNPFNDPNLHETFTWNKKKEATKTKNTMSNDNNPDKIEEIETIRRRRKERELEREEMDRLRAEESRMKELENYDDWAKKEEEFHLEQQRKRSAIRLVEGREKPVDILAKNLLIFGLTEEEKKQRAAVKYQERYNALDELQKLDAELEEPQNIVGILKLAELQELLGDIEAFRLLEKEAMGGSGSSTITLYWDALALVVKDEIEFLRNGGEESRYAKKVKGIKDIFRGQSRSDLTKMEEEIKGKVVKSRNEGWNDSGGANDISYWNSVLKQLSVHLAKMDLSKLHSKMLVRQLEQLESRKEFLSKQQRDVESIKTQHTEENSDNMGDQTSRSMVPKNVDENFGNLEEELGLSDEVALANGGGYSWQDRYAPRKPRYFNRIRTGFDWNKYNQTHYDTENPPPKIVQGYKFNVFYPDLVDPTKTPQYFLERADTDDFCILRFHAGPPYEDIAFKIVNREWNKSRKRGFRSTFERGVLSLYFNFTSHWYRR